MLVNTKPEEALVSCVAALADVLRGLQADHPKMAMWTL